MSSERVHWNCALFSHRRRWRAVTLTRSCTPPDTDVLGCSAGRGATLSAAYQRVATGQYSVGETYALTASASALGTARKVTTEARRSVFARRHAATLDDQHPEKHERPCEVVRNQQPFVNRVADAILHAQHDDGRSEQEEGDRERDARSPSERCVT